MLYVWEGGAVRKRGYRPNLESIITDETNEGSIAAYGREVPDTPVKITVAELPETTVMHKKMSAPEIRRDDFQGTKIQRI
jgi:hypothetical protein